MRPTFLLLPAAVVSLGMAAVIAVAQAPQPQGPSGAPSGEHHHPPNPTPTNLKVLPKTLNGDQVHEIMHKWAADLGVECDTCHAADPTRKMPNGHAALNFADDSKPEKQAARLMYQMTEDINKNYTSMVTSSHDNAPAAKTVGCGTCHRGKLDPPAFVPPPGHEHEHHESTAEKPAIPR